MRGLPPISLNVHVLSTVPLQGSYRRGPRRLCQLPRRGPVPHQSDYCSRNNSRLPVGWRCRMCSLVSDDEWAEVKVSEAEVRQEELVSSLPVRLATWPSGPVDSSLVRTPCCNSIRLRHTHLPACFERRRWTCWTNLIDRNWLPEVPQDVRRHFDWHRNDHPLPVS